MSERGNFHSLYTRCVLLTAGGQFRVLSGSRFLRHTQGFVYSKKCKIVHLSNLHSSIYRIRVGIILSRFSLFSTMTRLYIRDLSLSSSARAFLFVEKYAFCKQRPNPFINPIRYTYTLGINHRVVRETRKSRYSAKQRITTSGDLQRIVYVYRAGRIASTSGVAAPAALSLVKSSVYSLPT